MDNRGEARVGGSVAQEVIPGHNRLKTVDRPEVLRDAPTRTILGTTRACLPISKTRPPPARILPDPVQSHVLFSTKSGLDVTPKIIELMWLASGRNYLSFEEIQKHCANHKLTPDDIAFVCRVLGESGVNLIEASAVRSVQLTARSLASDSVQSKLQNDSTQNFLREIGEEPRAQPQMYAAPLIRMEAADHEMRQILYGFGFAAHQHVVWAKKLIACPSAESLEHMLAGSEIRNRRQFFKALPHLVKQVQAVDQKAAAVYRAWRQAKGQPNGDEFRAEFGKLNHKLQQMLPQFCYKITVIHQMIAIAQNIAVQLRDSQHVHEQIQHGHSAVCRLPLADVELQAIETMEEFVRMPCEMFLRNCAQLKSVAAEFHQARCQLVYDHLPLVASIAETYPNERLPLLGRQLKIATNDNYLLVASRIFLFQQPHR